MSRDLDCAAVQEALSALLDGEPVLAPQEALDAHVGGCADCGAYAASVHDLTRRARLRRVDPGPAPDVTNRVAAVATNPLGLPGAGPWPLERVLLLVLGIAQLVLSVPPLLGEELAASVHVTREVGVTDLALAVGLLAAAWQPWRAAGMLPVIVTLAAGLAAVAVLDIADGRVSAVNEAPHLLAPVSALLLYLLRRRTPSPGGGSAQDEAPGLRVVGEDGGAEGRRSA